MFYRFLPLRWQQGRWNVCEVRKTEPGISLSLRERARVRGKYAQTAKCLLERNHPNQPATFRFRDGIVPPVGFTFRFGCLSPRTSFNVAHYVRSEIQRARLVGEFSFGPPNRQAQSGHTAAPFGSVFED